MSPIALGLELFVAALLIAALAVGTRLNGRLKTLREGQALFVKAVGDLDEAAARAQVGLADLRAASETAHDQLLARIETARGLAKKLERLSSDADRVLTSAPPVAAAAPARAMAAVAALAQRTAAGSPRGESPPPRQAPAPRTASPRRGSFDDDLFEPPAGLGPLRPKEERR